MQTVQVIDVIDASGTWTAPNPAVADGLPAMGRAGCGCGATNAGVPETAAVSCCAQVAE